MKKRVMLAGALVLLGGLAGCSRGDSAVASQAKKAADDYQVTQMVTKWHEATECHYFDTGTHQLVNSVSGDARVVRRGQGWFFTNLAGASATLG